MSSAEKDARRAFCETSDKTLTANRYLAWNEATSFHSDKEKHARELLVEAEAERVIERCEFDIEQAQERERIMRAIAQEAVNRMSTVAGRLRLWNRSTPNPEIKSLANNLAEPLTLMRELCSASRMKNK